MGFTHVVIVFVGTGVLQRRAPMTVCMLQIYPWVANDRQHQLESGLPVGPIDGYVRHGCFVSAQLPSRSLQVSSFGARTSR